MDELLLLIQSHLDGQLTPEQSQELQDRLRDDPAALEIFVQTHRIDQQLRECLPGEKAAVQFGRLIAELDAGAVVQRNGPMARVARSLGRVLSRPSALSVTAAALFIGSLITTLAFVTAPIYQRWAGKDDEDTEIRPLVIGDRRTGTMVGAGFRLQGFVGFPETLEEHGYVP